MKNKCKMTYLSRTTTIRDYQGRHHKAVYVEQLQYFKTDNLEFIKNANFGKKIKFTEITDKNLKLKLRKLEKNKIYYETEQLTDSEIHFRPSITIRPKW